MPPPFISASPFNRPQENSYTPARRKTDYSIFFWLALGIGIIAGMFYFLKQAEVNLPSSAAEQSLSDTTDSVAPAESPEEIRRRRMAEKLAAKNKNYRNNWSSYIKVKPGKMEKSLFGGIYNLEALVSNKTDYPLDVMIISIDYIKESGETHKTEILTVYDIPANGEATVRAPDSDRGTSVKLEIIQISSKRMNFLYSNDVDPEGKPDPYYLNR